MYLWMPFQKIRTGTDVCQPLSWWAIGAEESRLGRRGRCYLSRRPDELTDPASVVPALSTRVRGAQAKCGSVP